MFVDQNQKFITKFGVGAELEIFFSKSFKDLDFTYLA